MMSYRLSSSVKKVSGLYTVFRTEDCCYLYSAWTSQLIRISKELFQFFADHKKQKHATALAVELGLLPEAEIPLEIYSPQRVAEAIQSLSQNGPETLILPLTEQCSVSCDSCLARDTDSIDGSCLPQRMQTQTALAAIEWYAKFQRLTHHICFTGCELLWHFDFIKDVVAYAKSAIGDTIQLSLTTNGWPLSAENAQFLSANNVQLIVHLENSWVAEPQSFTASAKPTFDLISSGIEMLAAAYPEYTSNNLRLSIPHTPPENLLQLHNLFTENAHMLRPKVIQGCNWKQSTINNESGAGGKDIECDRNWAWDNFVKACQRGETPGNLSRAICERSVANLHLREIGRKDLFRLDAGRCDPGQCCYVNHDGELQMCGPTEERLVVGTFERGYDLDAIADYLSKFGGLVEEFCKDCWAVRLCTKCIPQLADDNDHSRRRIATFCNDNRSRLQRDLIRYCAAREASPKCFDWLTDSETEPFRVSV